MVVPKKSFLQFLTDVVIFSPVLGPLRVLEH